MLLTPTLLLTLLYLQLVASMSPASRALSNPVARELNRRWERGQPSDNLTAAGLLVHVLDGDGLVDLATGALNEKFDASDPLGHIWAPNPALKTGDRLSATLINRRHPDILRFVPAKQLGAFGEAWVDLPALVLKPSSAVSRRITCLSAQDASSLGRWCERLGLSLIHI